MEHPKEVYKLHRELLSGVQNQLQIHAQTNSCACPTPEKLNAALHAIFVDYDNQSWRNKWNENFPIFDAFLKYICISTGMSNCCDNKQYRRNIDLLSEKLSSIPDKLCRSTIFFSPEKLVELFHLSETTTNTTNYNNPQIMIQLLECCLIRDELWLIRNNGKHVYQRLYCAYFRHFIDDENTCENIRMFLILLMSTCESAKYHKEKLIERLMKNNYHSLILGSLEGSFLLNPEDRENTQIYLLKIMEKMNLSESNQNQTKPVIKKIYESISKEYMRNGGLDYAKLGYKKESIQDIQLKLMCYCLTMFDGAFCTETNEDAPKFPASLDPNYRDSTLKLSHDKLFVRRIHDSTSKFYSNIRSVNSVKSGIFYYEVFFINFSWCKVGWANARARITGTGIGDDENSIGFGYSMLKHCDQLYEIENLIYTTNGSVIGCLIDFSKRQFTFSYNGERIRLKKNYFFFKPEIYFSTEFPYFAAIELDFGTQCYVNFGQVPFKYRPMKVEYWDFCLNEQFGKQSQVDRGISNIKANNSQIIIGSTYTNGGDFNIRAIEASNSSQNSSNVTNDSAAASQTRICSMCKKQAKVNLKRFVCCDNLTFCHACSDLIKDCPVHRV